LQELKVFLLDIDFPKSLNGSIKEILESSRKPNIKTVHCIYKTEDIQISINHIFKSISNYQADLVFIVFRPDSLTQIKSFIPKIFEKFPKMPVLIAVEGVNTDEIIELLKYGIVDFITPPFKKVDIVPRIWCLIEQKQRRESLIHKIKEKIGLKQLVGKSPVFQKEIEKIPFVANCDASVLITGETGTGKELVARAIHYCSPRAYKPFIPVNCGAIPSDLVESELFGHIQGAFTGADRTNHGLIHEAEGGTLFLDEINCLPLLSQVKLLRFLQEKEYRPIGSPKILHSDVRIITSTNIDIENVVQEGTFRKDLFYRLNVIPIKLPRLRDRKEDIVLLAEHFLNKYASEFSKNVKSFDADALQRIIMHAWPGNVRELENVIERAVVFSTDTSIHKSDINLPYSVQKDIDDSFQNAKARVISEFEKDYIHRLLLAYKGNISKAARAADKNRRAFWELLRKYNIDVQGFKTKNI
jgi:two-component system, NtrC family, response regulator GlrR